jgi:hypothetical protein
MDRELCQNSLKKFENEYLGRKVKYCRIAFIAFCCIVSSLVRQYFECECSGLPGILTYTFVYTGSPAILLFLVGDPLSFCDCDR